MIEGTRLPTTTRIDVIIDDETCCRWDRCFVLQNRDLYTAASKVDEKGVSYDQSSLRELLVNGGMIMPWRIPTIYYRTTHVASPPLFQKHLVVHLSSPDTKVTLIMPQARGKL